MSDHPYIRTSMTCPHCTESKPLGNIWCWPCHNEIQGGTDEERESAERHIDKVEARLERLIVTGRAA